MGAVVGEGEKYFFTVDCPIGVQEHIHICIKRYNKILLFSTCSCLAEDEVIPPQWPVPDYVAHLLEAASVSLCPVGIESEGGIVIHIFQGRLIFEVVHVVVTLLHLGVPVGFQG